MKLYIARHGQTDFNKRNILNAQIDEPLSEEGKQQIPELVTQAHDQQLDAIYSSTLTRAIQTATPVAKDHHLVLQTDARICEVNAGSLAGQPYDSTVPLFGLMSRDLLDTYVYDMRAQGGESAWQVRQRVADFLNDLGKTEHASVMIVTHGGTLRWFHYLLTGEKASFFKNVSLNTYDFDPSKAFPDGPAGIAKD